MPTSYHLVFEDQDTRLDMFVAGRLPEITRSHVKKLIDEGRVTVSGRPGKPALKLRPGDAITVTVPDPEPTELLAQDIPLTIVYEDADLLVVDKPAGLTVHPGPGHASNTLVNAVLAHCPDLGGINGSVRPGIVHRLDKDTSGLIMVAKNDTAQLGLSRQIKERTISKKYLALIKGAPPKDTGAIDAPIARDPRNRKRMAVVPEGRRSRTEYRVLRHLSGYTLVEAFPISGRTHQIRVHFASIGHPLLGDQVYGGKSPLLARQFLHAAELNFCQPRTGAPIHCAAPLPPDLARVLAIVEAAS